MEEVGGGEGEQRDRRAANAERMLNVIQSMESSNQHKKADGEREKREQDEEVGKGRKEGREGGREGGRRTYFATKLNL